MFKKRTTSFVGFVVLWLFFSSSLDAQESIQNFSLEEAQQYAIENGFSNRTATKEVEKSERIVEETISTGLPQISGSGSYQQFLQTPTQLIPGSSVGRQEEFVEVFFGTEQNMGLEIRAEQLIFDGSYFVGLQASKVFLELSKNDRQKTIYETRQMVTQAYGAVLVGKENVNILKKNVENREKNYRETKALFENGFLEEQDKDQMQLLLSSAKNAYENSIRQAEISLNQLKLIMGLPLEKEINLTDKLQDLLQLQIQADYEAGELDLKKHIDYRIVNTQEQASQLLLKQQKSFYLPRLTAFYSYQQNSFSNEFNFFSDARWFPTQLIGLNLNVPLFSGFGRLRRTQQAKIELEQVEIAKEQVSARLEVESQQAKSDYAFAISQYQTAKENKALAESIFQKTTIKYQEGISSSLELTQANNQLIESQGNYINAALQLINAKANYDRAFNNYE